MGQIKVIKEQEVLGRVLRIYGDVENPLFLAKDVAEWIGHTDMTRMVGMTDDDEKLTRTLYESGQNREMWLLTEDGLYEVLMRSRKPIAKTFRKEIKAILRQIRVTGGYIPVSKEDDDITIMAKAHLILQKTIDQKDKLISDLQPKADFADRLIKSNDNIKIREFAKTISSEGFIIGEKQLFQWLRDNKYLTLSNEPYQRFVTNGAFVVRRHVYKTIFGEKLTFTPLITPKGQPYLLKKILEDFNSKKEIA